MSFLQMQVSSVQGPVLRVPRQSNGVMGDFVKCESVSLWGVTRYPSEIQSLPKIDCIGLNRFDDLWFENVIRW